MTGGTTPNATEPGTLLPERRVRARNLFRDAANRIHDDAVTRQYGYAGALVAGVTVSPDRGRRARPIAHVRHTATYRLPAPEAGEEACHE